MVFLDVFSANKKSIQILFLFYERFFSCFRNFFRPGDSPLLSASRQNCFCGIASGGRAKLRIACVE